MRHTHRGQARAQDGRRPRGGLQALAHTCGISRPGGAQHALALRIAVLVLVALSAAGACSGPALGGPLVAKAPRVTHQPASATVEEGQSASFEATATGSPEPTVQWERSTNGGQTWSPLAGAESDRLTLASVSTTESGYEFRATFRNSAGEASSKAAILTVQDAPLVTLQPAEATAEEGENAVFEAGASGFPAPAVQWELSTNGGHTWKAVTGATSTKLTLVDVKTSENAYQYRAVFTNAAGKVTSDAATLTVRNAPMVTRQPNNVSAEAGQAAVFEATGSGFPTPTVQWEVSVDGGETWSAVNGATSPQLTITATTSESGHEFRAVFTNAAGSATSAPATLTVTEAPRVSTQPTSITVEAGQGAVFEASASGIPTATVQWEVSTNGGGSWSTVLGATSQELTIAETKTTESGDEFRAVFTNAEGKATSSAATLTVASNNFHAVGWGENGFGQLGDGMTGPASDVPVITTGLNFVTSVAAGSRHSLALLADGTVAAWGSNGSGQLGDGTNTSSDVPITVAGLSGVKAISAGANFSLALLSNGTVMAWGENEGGQLGTGNTTESAVPVAVKGLSNVRAISAGGGHSLALLSNGTVMAWGENENGELGTGNTRSSDTPVAVKGLSGVTAVSAGGNFSLALLGNGTVKAWGSNADGQLANDEGEEGSSDVPVDVEPLTGVTAVAAGASHALALLNSGTVMAWGEDSDGELGNGTTKAHEATPVAVSGLSGVAAISAGGRDSVALLEGGSVMTWGINKLGTLGDGTTGASSDVPVAVAGLRKVASVSAGGSQMLAFGEPIPVITGVSPKLGPAKGQNTVTVSGVNLTTVSAVSFGATPASSFTVTSPTSLEAVAPAGTGTVDITVTGVGGVSPPVAADRYTYQQLPSVTKLSAKSGPAKGGTPVTITGTEFTGATKVAFGAVDATEFTVNSSTAITVTAPPGSGTVDVTVTNSDGSSATSSKDRFKYVPAVEGVAPNSGTSEGGTRVTVTGTGFAPGSGGTSFKFGAKKATAVDCASSTTCTMLSPAGAGTVDVIAQTGSAKSSANAPGDQFTYLD